MLASKFIDSVKRRASIPTAQDLLTDNDILALADEEMRSQLIPWLLKASEEHLVEFKDVPIQAQVSKYTLPKRTQGMKLRDVQLVDAQGAIKSLPRLFVEDRSGPQDEGFLLESNHIELLPTPQASSGSIRFTYHRAPSSLVGITKVQKVSAISGLNVTVESLPTSISTGSLVDLIPKSAPHYSLADDVEVTGASGTIITLSSVPSTLKVGDYVALSGETPFVQLPSEITPLLIQMVVVKVHEALAKFDSAKWAQERLNEMKQELLEFTSPRVDGEPKKIKPNALSRVRRRLW